MVIRELETQVRCL